MVGHVVGEFTEGLHLPLQLADALLGGGELLCQARLGPFSAVQLKPTAVVALGARQLLRA